jgi:hypothetical protein
MHDCVPTLPPVALILTGWEFSNDIEKKNRWEETVEWAERNGCSDLVNGMPDSEFYFVDEPTTYMVGPMGEPMYRLWDFEPKERPSPEVIKKGMKILREHWAEIAGEEIFKITCPITFTGKKCRRLLIRADTSSKPPWGGWNYLSHVESKRATFTRFRSSVNKAISPHEVDHIEFLTEELVVRIPFSRRKKPCG